MNIPVISQLISLIEEILKAHAPTAVKAAEDAAAGAALATVEADPKVQAITTASAALLTAAQSLKAAMEEHPAAAAAVDEPTPPAA